LFGFLAFQPPYKFDFFRFYVSAHIVGLEKRRFPMISSMLPPFYHLVAFRSAVWLEGHFAVPRLAPPCLQFEDLLQAPAMVRLLSFVLGLC
jgi:hypothetical protein